METKFTFGTYNVPSTTVNLSATYTMPGMVSKEMMEKITNDQAQKNEKDEIKNSSFDQNVKTGLPVSES